MGMKAVILAGGLGSRISEETHSKPKPMIEIGGMPILWHIMKIYSTHGINDFLICCGYKGHIIKEYFSNYFEYMSDITFDIQNNKIEIHKKSAEPWKVTVVDTGEDTMTGGRLRRLKPFLQSENNFCLTYGDGLSDVNIGESIKYHYSHGKKVTLTAVYPPGRFGALELADNLSVKSFREKPKGDGGLVNGGFFVLSNSIIDYIKDDSISLEKEPLELLAESDEIKAFIHKGFWQPMDTLRDKNYLENLWKSNNAPWKIWDN